MYQQAFITEQGTINIIGNAGAPDQAKRERWVQTLIHLLVYMWRVGVMTLVGRVSCAGRKVHTLHVVGNTSRRWTVLASLRIARVGIIRGLPVVISWDCRLWPNTKRGTRSRLVHRLACKRKWMRIMHYLQWSRYFWDRRKWLPSNRICRV